ncbi:hypothetical protein M9458_038375, partial [Cirrhinus mrigala]
IKDILKGALRFNQSQLESEENEEITIADDHYCSSQYNALNDQSDPEHSSEDTAGSTIIQQMAPQPSDDQEGDMVAEKEEHEQEQEEQEKVLPTENINTIPEPQ